ncbi:EscI/YscI/HrpB family type III secretion system inner rod protein [Bradyrhizobium elkanii]|uniref:EscI/YscI/HrpB family type III secretion system inner rod protein n=1 Tax=Bradyrhizobium elkanii TaxID=29448 RepID=UPI002226CAAE|nr:EscI/YscI/HrpB family type III secretion system inner rod protein [Bradyrhizobium elkanii]MCW2130698.1 type III secretion system YscI/HrpB-like protein [Bradyrhizobium elkanii]MCW2175854.1 type III secretion system YscI/HrpB-like protein [Bradyrhizobium elkanii]
MPATSKVSAESVEAFRAALEPSVPSQRADEPLIMARGGVTEVGPLVPRLSDDILSGMEKLSAGFAQSMQGVRSAAEGLNAGNIRSAEWLDAQVELSAMSLQYDLVTKVVGKATHTLDTFLNSQ